MTQSITHAFENLYKGFAAPYGDTLRLAHVQPGGDVDILFVSAETETHEPNTLTVSGKHGVSDIHLVTEGDAKGLQVDIDGQQVLAADWTHLAEQLHTLGLPNEVLNLFWQLGGDRFFHNHYKVAM